MRAATASSGASGTTPAKALDLVALDHPEGGYRALSWCPVCRHTVET